MSTSLLDRYRRRSAPPRNPRLVLPWLSDGPTLKKFATLGVSAREIRRLAKLGERQSAMSKLFRRPLFLSSPFWYLHSLKEIFLDETYLFNSNRIDPLILDCGANIGLSVIYFKRRYPAAKIIAFEPDPQIFSLLQRNTSGLPGPLELIPKAVWTCQDSLSFSGDGSVGGRLATPEPDDALTNRKKVDSVRLRDYLSGPVDLLKIDIEGAEYEVLKDCANALEQVQNLFIEYHSLPDQRQTLAEMLQWITEAGFRYYIKEAWENMTHPFTEKKGIYYDLQLNIFAYRTELEPVHHH